MVRSIAAAACLVAVAACTPAAGPGGGPRSAYADGHSPKTPAATPIGPAQSCIPLGQISESRVRDDWTIDFRVGTRWYRNVLPQRCSGLGFQQTFGYATSQAQLCSVDIITVLQTGAGGGPRGSCGLGQFQPVTLQPVTPAK
ncbi:MULTISPECIES: hypothetical protein [unclassified Sphingomonas]|uniref:hypothetical protein n=1 Tax=Novosphingobium rhizosphaerae TaxID=1551649 RepID=UPI0015CA0237